MILIRLALVGLIVYLLVRSFMSSGEKESSSSNGPESGKSNASNKKISKKTGEYVDFQEVDKNKN